MEGLSYVLKSIALWIVAKATVEIFEWVSPSPQGYILS